MKSCDGINILYNRGVLVVIGG